MAAMTTTAKLTDKGNGTFEAFPKWPVCLEQLADRTAQPTMGH
jgi:hypothetical protein